MKGTNIGELEELVMLTVAILYDDAYGVAIQKEIQNRCNRTISISTVHSVLSRLEDKGFVNSRYGGASPERGGRRKHLFRLTIAGQKVVADAKEMRNTMWASIPKFALSNE